MFRLWLFDGLDCRPVVYMLRPSGERDYAVLSPGSSAAPDALDADDIGPAVAAVLARHPGGHVRVERAEGGPC